MGRILHYSDIHFGVENRPAVDEAMRLAHENPPDLVLISGDITQQGYRREFAAAAEWINAMPEPVFVIIGNHDVPYWDPVARILHPWRRFEEMVGHPAHDHQYLSDKLMVRGVATARGWQARLNWSKGVIDLDQTRRAAAALRTAPAGVLRVLACHHPLIEMIGAPMTGEVKRGREAAQIFAEAGVDLIMSGHVHVPFALPVKMGEHCSYAVGCGTLSLRERGAPVGYNCIEWDETGIEVTAMGWTGSHFEPQRTWHLERIRR
ncbi:metallophosphoesterase [Brevundimonas sp. 2R-24]|uniref:Metallophosphoesterase n=1 Tax=Peiella sedimenti TaxID=3061083 RepID=A0ABT8SL43_9CAUL|nr:metallophosphoesterase [Caulobacteraceae bacterium XZ-24]